MLIFHLILAAGAVVAVAARPGSWRSAATAAGCACLAVAAGVVPTGGAGAAVADVLPPVAFIASAMALALLADHQGLASRLAAGLARAGKGRTRLLFGWVCVTCALLTAAISLDGAVVLMWPVLAALEREHGAPLRPLLLGSVGVANSFSAALPAGNPTNLVVMERLGLSPGTFAERMLPAALGATLACAALLGLLERRRLRGGYERSDVRPAATGGGLALGALVAAAVADWVSPAVGLSPWLPASVVAAVALLAARRPPLIALPLRTGVQIASLLILLGSLAGAVGIGTQAAHSAIGLLAVAAAVTACAALLNNLPASAAVSALLGAGPGSYAALLGLSAGALATPHGSVATLVSLEMSGYRGRLSLARSWGASAAVAVIAGTAVLWLTG